jgi:type I restriction enzyme S subunit
MKLKKEFRLRPLGELCEVTGGNSAPQGEEYFRGGTIPFVRMRDLGGYHHTTCLDTTRDAVTPATVEKMRLKIFEPGCILFPRSGSVQLNHRAILAIRACIVSHIGILKQFSEDIEVRYIYWFLVRYDMGVIAKQTTGLDLVGFSDVKKISIPVPATRAEQRRIVAEIEKQFTRLEAGVAALRRVQANLKRYRAAVLKAACEGQLVPTEAELAKTKNAKFEHGDELLARILARRKEVFEQEKARGGRRKYDEPSPIEPGALPLTPDGWTLASAESVCSSVRDGTHDTPAYVQDGVPLITSKNLLPTGLDFDNVKLVSREDHIEIGKRSGVDRGDILFAMIGTIGNPVVVETDREFSIKNVGLFKANPDFILSRYLRYWFMSPPFTRWLEPKQRGTTQKFVPLGLLRALVVALPPLAEQTRIVAEVERRLSVVEELESVVTANLQRATRLRQSILQKAFTGGLVS